VLEAPPASINEISFIDVDTTLEPASLQGLTLSELYAPRCIRAFLRTPIPGTKVLKKVLLSRTSLAQVLRHVQRERIDVLLSYNLSQEPLFATIDCHKHFDLADDLLAMMDQEGGMIARVGGQGAARRVQRRILSVADTVSVASSVLSEQLSRPALLLPNGADPAVLDEANGSEWRARGLGPCVGFLGAFEYWVDFELVLELARCLPKLTFLLVGGGRRWMEVKRATERRSLRNVYFTGPVSHERAMDYVAAMDVCLVPLRDNGVSHGACPLKLFEYAALKKPIVSTRTKEVLRIGRGWVAFGDAAADFAGAIEYFLSNPAAAAEAGSAGRMLVEQSHNWLHLAHQFADFLAQNGASSAEEVSSALSITTDLFQTGRLAPESAKPVVASRCAGDPD
jgi:glycosyltransferase involved in cell wall biosynthesis